MVGSTGDPGNLFFIEPTFRSDINFTPDDRFQRPALAFLIKLDSAKQYAMIGQGKCCHLEFDGGRNEVIDSTRPVQ
jgi:hypothetical protein